MRRRGGGDLHVPFVLECGKRAEQVTLESILKRSQCPRIEVMIKARQIAETRLPGRFEPLDILDSPG